MISLKAALRNIRFLMRVDPDHCVVTIITSDVFLYPQYEDMLNMTVRELLLRKPNENYQATREFICNRAMQLLREETNAAPHVKDHWVRMIKEFAPGEKAT
jgi:hypothetical protein